VVAFLAFFIAQPLRALEENLLFITWLGIIYNTYWTRLMYTSNLNTAQQDLETLTKTTIAQLEELVKKHGQAARGRPGQKEEGKA
jgi:hypothetical protein